MKKFAIHWKGLCNDSAFDWYFCLACFAIALIVVAGIDVLLYVTIMRADAPRPVGSTAPTITLNRAYVDGIAKTLNGRDKTPHIVPESVLRDPSL